MSKKSEKIKEALLEQIDAFIEDETKAVEEYADFATEFSAETSEFYNPALAAMFTKMSVDEGSHAEMLEVVKIIVENME